MKPRHERIGGYRPNPVAHTAPRHRIGRLMAQILPPKVDLRPFLTDVEEQVGSSCVANAFAGAYEYLAKRALGEAGDVSRLFVYYNARLAQGDQDEDAGSMMESAIEGLKQYGACNESFWPNSEDSVTEEPTPEAYENAENFTITSSEFIETELELWKHTLAEGSPIAFALNTFDSFDAATDNKGRVPMPKTSDNVRETHGWHAMLCVGYVDKDQMFIVRNSWGGEWGDSGYCYIPYRYVMHEDFNGNDSWIVSGISDLDFSSEVWSADDGSYFAGPGSIQLFNFFCRTDDVEGFATALESLCNDASTDEGCSFDYEEVTRDDATFAEITNLDIAVEDRERFESELNTLCTEWAGGDDYEFEIESADGEDAGEDDEEDGEDADEPFELTGFYVYSYEGAVVVGRIDELLAAHTTGDDETYRYEYEEDEDDDGPFVSFTTFAVTAADVGAFLAALQELCEQLAAEGGYNWDDPADEGD